MSMWGFILGSVGAAVCAMMFFMITAFGGGGLVAPGRPPLSKRVEAYLSFSLVAGPLLCGFFGLVPWIVRWIEGSAQGPWWFAVPPALTALQVALILRLFR